MERVTLNQYHRRNLTIAMRQVMGRLDEFSQILAAEVRSGQSEIDPERIREISDRVAGARQRVEAFCTRFDLDMDTRTDPLWKIQVGVSRLWEMLEDCKSGPLRGYGAVPEATRPVLDKEVQGVIDDIERIAAAAGAARSQEEHRSC